MKSSPKKSRAMKSNPMGRHATHPRTKVAISNALAGVLLLVLVVALPACDRKQRLAEQAAAQAAQTRQAAERNAADFDAAVSQQNWALARAQADVLIAHYPDSDAAKRVRGQYDAIKAKADAKREDARLSNLWSYDSEPVKGGKQLSASIFSSEPVDTGGGGPGTVRLIFRDHASWGKSSYLVLKSGDFDCYGGCKVKVTADDDAPRSMAASRPRTDEAIAMFIEDERALWRLARKSKAITIEFPVKPSGKSGHDKAGGKRSATFEVGGLDGKRMPGWD